MGVWGHAYFAYLGGGPEFGKTCLYNTWTLPYMQRRLFIDEAHTALDIFSFAVFLPYCDKNLVLDQLPKSSAW